MRRQKTTAMNFKIGIIVADVDEYKTLGEYAENGKHDKFTFLGRTGHRFRIDCGEKSAEVISVLCGIGKVNAAAAAMHLVDTGCNIILNYGLSGGISNVSRGELVACDKFLEHDFDLTVIGYKPCEKPLQKYIYQADAGLIDLFKSLRPDIKSGTAVTGDKFICDSDLRNSLKRDFGAMSCDMETAAIAYVCDFSGIPFFSLRRISDDAGSEAVSDYQNMNTADDTLLSDYIISFIRCIISSKNPECHD